MFSQNPQLMSHQYFGFPQAVPKVSSKTNKMRIRGEPQVFVSVAYDFEYVAEDGKRVFMKENEILLLINKTNHDWWQVIRKGDRRPFYAPAKYVVELRPEEVPTSELMAAAAASNDLSRGQNLNFSTFGPLKTKRSSYAPASGSSGVMLIPPPAASLESSTAARLRSNSLDSILVADLDAKQVHSTEHIQEMVAVHHHSQRPHASSATYHVFTQQHHFIPKNQLAQIRDKGLDGSNSVSSGSLTKRPTFEALDKRKSWTLEQLQQQQQQQLNASAAPGSVALASTSGSSDGGRSGRISAYQNTHIAASKKEAAALFLNNVNSSYDPRRKKPVPLPRSKIPVLLPGGSAEQILRAHGHQQRPVGGRFLGLGPRSKTDLTSTSLSDYKRRTSVTNAVSKYPSPSTPSSYVRPVPQRRDPKSKETLNNSDAKVKPRPEIKDKPTFSTFKQFNRTASLSDLINEEEDVISRKQPEVISRKKNANKRNRNLPAAELETASLASVSVNVPEPILPPTKSITVQTDEVDLNSVVNTPKPKSDPLRISTEPLNGGAEVSLSTSFDSMEDSKSKSTDVSMEETLAMVQKEMIMDDDEEDLPTPPATPPLEERLKSPVSTTSRSPPSPTEKMTPTRKVASEWEEYKDDLSGRKFYVNTLTKEKSWKPPRKPRTSECGALGSSPSLEPKSHDDEDEPPPEAAAKKEEVEKPSEKPASRELKTSEVPTGYEKRTDADSGNSYYVNVFTGVRWYSAEDSNGKMYYYEENGNESCWALPNVSQSIQDPGSSSATSTPEPSVKDEPSSSPKTKTELLEQRRLTLPVSTPDFKIGNVNISVIRQGPLHKTKLLENGKKQRKNWNVAHIVLTDTFLLFFKDAKSFANLQSGANSNSKPDYTIDLKGAFVDWCSSDKSKRSNVFEVTSAILGNTILLQDDSLSLAAEWLQEIRKVIENANLSAMHQDVSRRSSEVSQTLQLPKKANKVGRTKSLKMKILGSNEELLDDTSPSPTGASAITFTSSGKNNNIREKLRKFFLRRPAMDDLFRRGIMKNEPVFGSTLRELQAQDLSDVPNFVKKCIDCIEKGELLKTDGVYRQSGNLSTIQKIRLQVDQGNLAILDSVEDVHVLAGALKLFFRELKEPLIPWEIVGKLLLAANHQSKKQKVKQIKDCIATMPTSHRATLATLLKHLVKVTQFKEKNRMQIPNLAIVFGPTLMWPPAHLVSVNLALDMMQQNIIVEALLNNVQNIFP